MAKNATTYTVLVNDAAQEKTFSKKAKAVEAAEAARKAEKRATVQVVTGAGTVVFELKGPKTINMSKPYTREVELPEGFVIPEGLRPAYTRMRKGLVILHDPTGGEEGEGSYSVHDAKTNRTLISGLPTTRASGAFCKTVPTPAKV
jgi:hypothetical protein